MMENVMRKFATIILLSASLLAAACNTVKGVGEDIESVGEAGDRATWQRDNLSYIGKIISYSK
jgi:predicted small secreted protein